MNILFIYNSPLKKEKDGAKRATGLTMDELNRRGHRAISLFISTKTIRRKFL